MGVKGITGETRLGGFMVCLGPHTFKQHRPRENTESPADGQPVILQFCVKKAVTLFEMTA